MRETWPALFMAAIGCAILFLIATAGNSGILFLFLSSIPLLMLGLSRPAPVMIYAGAVALLLIGALGGLDSALFFLFFIAIPALLFAPRALLRDAQGGWFPAGVLIADLVLYAALLFLAAQFRLQDQGGLQEALLALFQQPLSQADSAQQGVLVDLIRNKPFLIIGVSAWWWVLIVYMHGIIANWLLKKQGRSLRPNLRIDRFSLPFWMLVALILMCLGSFVEAETQFICRTLLVIFLLPYYLLGVSYAAPHVRDWPNGQFWLLALHMASLLYVLPLLAWAAVGMWKQCQALLKQS